MGITEKYITLELRFARIKFDRLEYLTHLKHIGSEKSEFQPNFILVINSENLIELGIF